MVRKSRKLLLMFSLLMVGLTALNVQAATVPFDINMTVTGFSASQTAILNDAEAYWESVISGYQGDTTPFSLEITVSAKYIDGVGGTLGWGGPDWLNDLGGFTVATEGSMGYDSADINQQEEDGELYDTILHEIAHVMGFGTLWEDNGVYTDGSFQYTGAAALAAYQAEFGLGDVTFVPVENDGGEGTAGGHWEYDSALADDLMIGWTVDDPPASVSQTTLASFVDIGYVLTPVPLPGAFFLLASGLLGLIGLKRRGR